MKTALLSFFITALSLSGSLAGSVPAPYEVGTWRGFRPAAISYTFDDGCSNQFSVAVPMFNQKGFKLTLFTVISTLFPGWPKLQDAAANGHEVAAHTMTHVNLGGLPDAQQITELKDCRDAINANLPGQKCLTMAYPYCVAGKDALTAQYYLAARTCSGQLVPSTPANFMAISSFVCGSQGSVQTIPDFNNKANSAAAAKAWCVYLLHGIDNDGGYSPVSTATLRGSLDYLSANPDKFWVESFGNVARYILERNAVSVTETASGEDRFTLQVTDNLEDAVYNVPITLRRPLPGTWSGAAVSQNNRSVGVRIVEVSSQKYVMFDVVPDGGEVIISKEVIPPVLSSPVLTNSTSFYFRLDGQAGARYAIYSSQDLVSWLPIQTNTLLSTCSTFTVAAPDALQFYRAQWAP